MSNLAIRVFVAAIAIPIILWLALVGGFMFYMFVALTSSIALWEFYKLMERKGSFPAIGLGLAGGLAVTFSFIYGRFQFTLLDFLTQYQLALPVPTPRQLLLTVLLVLLVATLLYELFRKRGSAIANIGATVFGVVYVSLFFGALVGLRELFVPGSFPAYKYFELQGAFVTPEIAEKVYDWGGYTIISIFATIWICDSAAFFGGKILGRHKLMEYISPHKTWEGAALGFFFAIVASVWAKFFILEYLTYSEAIVIGLIVGVFGQAGDLVESLLKRDAEVKDSSHLIPGHGGVLDRFDSLIFVSPLVYLYVDFIVL